MTRRTERVGNLIRSIVAEVLMARLSDPRIDPGMTSITRVEVSDDLAAAKVYVSVMGEETAQRNTLRALRHAAGRIQEIMRKQIQLRNTPVLDFQLDEKFKKTLQTLSIIQKVSEELKLKDQKDKEKEENQDETSSR